MNAPRVVVITGASSGIGRAAALAFAQRGENLVLASRRGGELEALVADCEVLGARAIAVPTDVADNRQVKKLAAEAVGRFGHIDVWVNNASVSAYGRFLDVPLAATRRVLDVNLMGHVHGARAALKVFSAQGTGTLVNVSSIIGEVSVPYMTAYSIAKAGTNALTESLRQELAMAGTRSIRVTSVMPATIDTPFYRNVANYSGRRMLPPPPVYPPEIVAAAIVRASRHPKREVFAGPAGGALVVLHRLLPGPVETGMAALMEATRRAGRHGEAPTSGGIVDPTKQDPATISGGWNGRSRYTRRRLVVWSLAAAALGTLAARTLRVR